jgi:hypothetical protein
MFTLRQMAMCLHGPFEVIGSISVLSDIFGVSSAPKPLSLLARAGELAGKVVDVNLIRSGDESMIDDAGDVVLLLGALGLAAEIFAQVDLALRVASHFVIPGGDWEFIDTDSEAQALTEEWSFPGDAVDVFLVGEIAGLEVGVSPIGGTCEKGRTGRFTGVVIGLEEDVETTGQAIAHEVAHYLGLNLPFGGQHSADPDNLMFPKVPNGAQLTAAQGQVMKQHCFVRTRCRPR